MHDLPSFPADSPSGFVMPVLFFRLCFLRLACGEGGGSSFGLVGPPRPAVALRESNVPLAGETDDWGLAKRKKWFYLSAWSHWGFHLPVGQQVFPRLLKSLSLKILFRILKIIQMGILHIDTPCYRYNINQRGNFRFLPENPPPVLGYRMILILALL